jgi:hypothetical protein
MDSIVPAESDGKVAPNEHEQYIAASIVGSMSDVVLGRLLKSDIAQALANQRAKYEALSDEESLASAPDGYLTAYYNGWEDGAWDMVERIRQVAR